MSPKSAKRSHICPDKKQSETGSAKAEAPISPKNCRVNTSESQTIAEVSKKMYTKIVPQPKVADPEVPEKNEYSVYEFYDEEDEKLKIKQKEERAKQQELKERTCKTCHTVFSDPLDVLRHKREAHYTKKIVISKMELEQYLKVEKSEKRKHCPICGRFISERGYKSSYIKHLMTHCKEHSYECKVCGMRFGRRDHWQLHEKRHIVIS